MKVITKIFLLGLVLAVMLCSIPLSSFAADQMNIDTSSVESDLENNYGNLALKFPKNELDTKIYLVTFMEYGYTSLSKEKSSDYGLYLYIYNPSSKFILSDTNKVQFATKWLKDENGNVVGSDYKKYDLVLLNANKNNTLIKMKVANPDSSLIYKIDGSRRYDISGIEVHEKDYTYKDYTVGYSYTFSGYGQGMSPQSLTGSTLKCEQGTFLTIKVDAHQVSYLTGDSALGKGYSNQINSVYFSVPSDIEEKYGDLYSIKYEYYHYYTRPMIVTDNVKSYNTLYADRGHYINDDWEYSLLYYENDINTAVPWVYFLYGAKDVWWSPLQPYVYDKAYILPFVTSVFYDSNGWKEGEIIVSADQLQSYFRNYKISYHTGRLFDYSADLFDLTKTKEGYKYGYHEEEKTVNDVFSLESYKDAHNNFLERWLDGIFDASKYDESIDNARYIQKVESDISKASASEVYLVDENEMTNLRSFYKSASSSGDNVYLLRYAAADDYYSLDLTADGLDGNFLMAQGNVYLNFDFIYFTFGDSVNHTVLAVASDPSDGFFNLTDTTPDGFDLEKLIGVLFVIIMALLVAFFIVNVVIPFLRNLFAGSSKRMSAPRPPRKKVKFKIPKRKRHKK